jgi:hypothetical protein
LRELLSNSMDKFSASQVRVLDLFHPDLDGQAALARVTWAASWWPTS